jgi:hypothetical protein
MPICAERGLAPKSSDLCKKAGFATGSTIQNLIDYKRPKLERRQDVQQGSRARMGVGEVEKSGPEHSQNIS